MPHAPLIVKAWHSIPDAHCAQREQSRQLHSMRCAQAAESCRAEQGLELVSAGACALNVMRCCGRRCLVQVHLQWALMRQCKKPPCKTPMQAFALTKIIKSIIVFRAPAPCSLVCARRTALASRLGSQNLQTCSSHLLRIWDSPHSPTNPHQIMLHSSVFERGLRRQTRGMHSMAAARPTMPVSRCVPHRTGGPPG